MLSPLQRTFPKHQQQTTTNLSPNLHAKHNYVVHYRNLKFYLEHGMVITKIYRVLTLYLKPYIQFNTPMRAASTSQFEKDLFTLMNNSVFGKTQEKLRNRINVDTITNENMALKRVCKPNFKRSLAVKEDLIIMQTTISNLKLCKPVCGIQCTGFIKIANVPVSL